MLYEVCSNTDIEPNSAPLTGKELNSITEIIINKTRLDIIVYGIWESRQQTFFNLRFFDPNTSRHLNKSLHQCKSNEQARKEKNI